MLFELRIDDGSSYRLLATALSYVQQIGTLVRLQSTFSPHARKGEGIENKFAISET